jgi:predicted DCC family thiol-disulfide oxidoreductase YuxK
VEKELDTLYYDGQCSLCTAEIQKLAHHTQGDLALVDIHQMKETDTTPSQKVLLGKLHLKTANGDWLVGIDANIRAWNNTPYAMYWRILGLPIVRLFSIAAYHLWLKLRDVRKQ